MGAGKPGAVAVRLTIDDEIHAALAVKRHVLGAVAGDGAEAQRLEDLGKVRRARAVYSTNSKPRVPIGFSQRLGV